MPASDISQEYYVYFALWVQITIQTSIQRIYKKRKKPQHPDYYGLNVSLQVNATICR